MLIKDIIDRLELRFPDKLPKKEVPMFHLGTLVGHQQVIEFLKELDKSLKVSK